MGLCSQSWNVWLAPDCSVIVFKNTVHTKTCLGDTQVVNELLIKVLGKMEAFRFGFDFPIQKKAAKISNSALSLGPKPKPRPPIVKRRRYRVRVRYPIRTVLVPVHAPEPKIKVPEKFSLDISNMFEILDM
jgi:hypothetical protein